MKDPKFAGFASESKKPRKSHFVINFFLSIVIIFGVFAGGYILTTSHFNHLPTEEASLPKLELFLGEVTIEQIDTNGKDIKYQNNTIIFNTNEESTTYENVEVKGHGNTTWDKAKKPYQIKLQDKEPILNLKKGKKWILLANAVDPTHLRNDTASYLKQMLKTKYNPAGTFIDLYIDGSYRGVYYLTEKVEVEKNRVDMTDQSGILIELDNIYGVLKGCQYDKKGDCLVAKELVNEDNKDVATQNFLDTFNSLRDAIDQKNYNKINKLIDVDSFVEYYLVNEFATNPDAYNTSFFMYKNGAADKIHAGPEWDFDLALGNKVWISKGVDQEIFFSPSEDMVLKRYLGKYDEVSHINSLSTIIYDLMEIPEFEAKVKEIFRETMSGKKEELLNHIKSQAEYIRPAALRDQERWKFKTNFDEEVEYLLDWVSKRYDHFEETYGANNTTAEPED